jgi:hypothetical protein
MQFEEKIESLLSLPPYSKAPVDRQAALVETLKEELDYAGQRHAGYGNYLQNWHSDFRSATRVADLPFLPVALLKANPPLSLVDTQEIKRTLTSSATTSQQPSRVVLDSPTAKRMTKGVVNIVRDFIGSARRPYLVVDARDLKSSATLGARSAAIQGLQPFASEVTHCLSVDEESGLKLEIDRLRDFAEDRQDTEVLIYGFTYILWNHLVKPLMAEGVTFHLPKARILHSGGWKRLQDQAVEKDVFNRELARTFGCAQEHIIDFYGMVETVGVIYPDCSEGNKHAPAFGEVIVRDPLTLEPVAAGGYGIVQVCSVLPTSFPGHLLLTEDWAQVISYDGCACGRRGVSFRFAGRIPKAELRGCGNLQIARAAGN